MGKQDPTIRWPDDSTRLNIADENELRFWAQRFHVGREMIRRAVAAVGPKFKDVASHLDYKRGNRSFS
jgi:uncharacterized protein DUF3606